MKRAFILPIRSLEESINRLDAELAPLKQFILPGGSPGSAYLHLARTVCRRCERRLQTLHQSEPLAAEVLQYINRLSDFLFTAARYANSQAGQPDRLWDSAVSNNNELPGG